VFGFAFLHVTTLHKETEHAFEGGVGAESANGSFLQFSSAKRLPAEFSKTVFANCIWSIKRLI
jgi:hypothetical protein